MRNILLCKFSQNEFIRNKLLSTGDVPLIEGNTWGDTFWGVVNGVGLNKMGKALMEVRELLRDGFNLKYIYIDFLNVALIKLNSEKALLMYNEFSLEPITKKGINWCDSNNNEILDEISEVL